MKRMSNEEIEEMIIMYKSGEYNFKDLDIYFGRGLGTCRGLLERRGYKAKSLSEINRKYSLNEDFFENIDNEKKAYFLGLLYADGCNFPEGTRVLISLTEEDKDILEEFKKIIGYNRPLYYKKNSGTFEGKPQYTLTISSKKISQDLEKLGMVKAKSLILKYPNISKELNKHFIRGYFDGDGCITSSIPFRAKRKFVKSDVKWSIVGTKSFCKSVQEILIENISLTKTKIYKKNKIYYLEYKGGKQIKKIKEWLYDNSTIFLKRKYDKFLNYASNNSL